MGLYLVDTMLDVTYSGLYLEKINNIANPFLSSIIGGAIDSGVDIIETKLFLSPQAQYRIRENNPSRKTTNSVYINKLAYV